MCRIWCWIGHVSYDGIGLPLIAKLHKQMCIEGVVSTVTVTSYSISVLKLTTKSSDPLLQ